MKENVGGADRIVRAVAAPVLIALGYTRLGGNRGALPGVLAIVTGALLAETAITRVCPMNELLGIDTARRIRMI